MKSILWMLVGCSLLCFYLMPDNGQEEHHPGQGLIHPSEQGPVVSIGPYDGRDDIIIPSKADQDKLNRLKVQLMDQKMTEKIYLTFGSSRMLRGSDLIRSVIFSPRDHFTIEVDEVNERIQNIWLGEHPL